MFPLTVVVLYEKFEFPSRERVLCGFQTVKFRWWLRSRRNESQFDLITEEDATRMGWRHRVRSNSPIWRVGFSPTHQMGKLDGLIDATRQMGQLDGSVGPTSQMDELDGSVSVFNKTDITSATGFWLTSYWWHWKYNLKLYLVWKYGLNQTMGRSSSIAKHLTRLCSSAHQKVRPNELDCLFGFVIHFSRVFCPGTFVESVSRKLSYKNAIFRHWFRRDRFWPQQLAPQLVRTMSF